MNRTRSRSLKSMQDLTGDEMEICGTYFSKYDLACAAIAGVLIVVACLLITTFFFFTLVVFGGPTY
jgi:hypothetical protein